MPDDPKSLRPLGDDRRVEALRDLGILDSPPERRFDDLIEELAEQLDAPIAYLALIDSDRQWIKSKVGPIPTEAEREHAFCSRAILGRETLVVEDATKDPRFSDSPLVTGAPHVRFYAGVPISDRDGNTLGTVCVAGPEPRELSARELVVLQGYANRLAEEVNARLMVLVVYASADADWMTRFLSRNRALERRGLVDPWSSDRLESTDGSWAIKDSLFRARAAVLLISPQFLGSKWVQGETFPLLHGVRETEHLTTIPLLLEPCKWAGISWLDGRTPWPKDGRPLSTLPDEQVDQILSGLAAQLLPEGETDAPAAPEPGPGAKAPPPAEPEEIAASPRLFLSHAGEDGAAVKALAERLKQAGVDVWLDLDELQPGDDWMEALEEALQESTSFAVYIGRSGVARWINREVRVALDRNTNDRDYRFIPILAPGSDPETLPSFVAQHQWLDLRDGENDPARLQKLVAAILSRPAEAVSLIPPGEAPFRGLASFDSDHAHLFFGRDRETQELINRLGSEAFLTVVGDSGSGKSSLVKAGLVPALIAGQMLDGGAPVRDWRIAVMRPGSHPFRELCHALMDLQPELDPAQKIATHHALTRQLAQGTDGLRACIAGLAAKGERTLLVVDQFEEVFTHASDEAERDRFIDTLLEASDRAGERPIYTVVTLRADLYSRCFEHPRLPMVISANQFAVRAIDREQMVDVIRKPAAMAGLKLEPGLVEAVLYDLGEGAGNLPLLQHTLLQLWNQRTGEILTHKSYDAIGRVQGALEHHAEEVYGSFSEVDQEAARKLFLRLVVADRAGKATRRRVPRDRLVPAGEAGAAAERVLQRLVEQRLVTVQQSAEEDGGVEELEVVHEALLRAWKRLRDWLDRDREFLLWRQRTRVAFEAWEEAGRDHGALLHGGPLAEARRWMRERGEDLSEDGRVFIGDSIALAQRKLWLKRAVMATIAALGLIAAWQAWQASRESHRARTQALVEQARGRQQDRLDVALLLGLEVDRRGAELDARRLLSEGLEGGPGLEMLLHGHQGDVRAVAWSPDGRSLASVSGAEPGLLLWDFPHAGAIGESPVGRPVGGAESGMWSVAWSPVGRVLAAGGESGAVLLWDLDVAPGEPRRLEDPDSPAETVYALRFSPDGGTVATARADQNVQLWDVATGQPAGPLLEGARDWLKSIAWSPDGEVVAAGGMDKTVRRWDVASGEPIEPPLRGHAEGVMSLDWSHDGRFLASGGFEGTTVIWDAASGERHRRLADSLIGSIASVAWAAGSNLLAVAGTRGRVQVWDVARDRPQGPPAVGQLAPLLGVAWSPDDRRLAAGHGPVVVVWRADGGPSLGQQLDLGAAEVRGLSMSPDGKLLAAVARDPLSRKLGIRIWSREDGQLRAVTGEISRGAPAPAWSGDNTLTSVTTDRSAQRWDIASGRLVDERRAGEGERVAGLAVSADGSRLAIAGRDGSLVLWDWESGESLAAAKGVEDARITELAWSPDGASLAAGADDGSVWLWDTTTAGLRGAPLAAHEKRVTSLAWSPDSAILASGGGDGVVGLWDSAAGTALGPPLAAHDERVTNLAWSADGGTLATAGPVGIRLWDVARREAWAGPLLGHDDTLTGLTFSPDGRTLTSVSFDGVLRHWDVDLESWRRRACRVAGRNLTPEEWRRYLPYSSYRETCTAYLGADQGRTGS